MQNLGCPICRPVYAERPHDLYLYNDTQLVGRASPGGWGGGEGVIAGKGGGVWKGLNGGVKQQGECAIGGGKANHNDA